MVSANALRIACRHCNLFQLCLPVGIDDEALESLDAIIERRPPIPKGGYLYRSGDPFRSVYAIRSGSIKTYTASRDGQEQVTGFHLAGELLGLDSINTKVHPCSARALETTSICEIPFEKLDALSEAIPGLQRQLLKVISKELYSEQALLTIVGKRNSLERLAAFLTSVSDRFRARGFSAAEFNLSMSRDDIGNYLGIAMETVSRMFARLQEMGIVEVDGRYVRILDMDALLEVGRPAEWVQSA